MTTSEVLMTAMMALVTVVIAGGVPWGYVIGQKVTRIESKLSNGLTNRIERHSDELSGLDSRIQTLEMVLTGDNIDHVRRVIRERQKRKQDQQE